MKSTINVFVTDVATHIIPSSVYDKAIKLSPLVRNPLKDRRTKSFKYLEQWAREQDESKIVRKSNNCSQSDKHG